MARPAAEDPYKGYNFRLILGGVTEAGFRECSGLDTSQDPIEYREGIDKDLTARKQPGLNKYSNITLKWGVTKKSSEIFDWRKKAQEGKVERIDGSIVLMDDTGQDLAQWDFRDAWPTKWTAASFNATSNEVAIESLEITHEGITGGEYK